MKKTKVIHTSKLLPPFEELFNVQSMQNLKLRRHSRLLAEKIPYHDKFCIFIGSSGAGRDTILESCLDYIGGALRIRRTTTREFREDVKDQTRMLFIDEPTFLKDFKSGKILFAGRYSANQKLYGISRGELSKLKSNHKKPAFLEENFSGLPLKVMLPYSRLIIVLPPSVEVLKQRLFNRDKSEEENEKRFQISVTEIKTVIDNMSCMIKEGLVDMVLINNDNPKKMARRISKSILSNNKIFDGIGNLTNSLKRLR